MPTDAKFARWLERQDACEEGRDFARGKYPRAAWDTCPRGDWLLWWAARASVDRRLVVRAACACARLALPRVPAGEMRPLQAIETAERWTRGEATINEARKAAYAAYAADAAYAAADAAYAAAYAASAAAYDAASAAYAYASAAAAGRTEVRAQCADLVRGVIPFDLVLAGMEVNND